MAWGSNSQAILHFLLEVDILEVKSAGSETTCLWILEAVSNHLTRVTAGAGLGRSRIVK